MPHIGIPIRKGRPQDFSQICFGERTKHQSVEDYRRPLKNSRRSRRATGGCLGDHTARILLWMTEGVCHKGASRKQGPMEATELQTQGLQTPFGGTQNPVETSRP